MTPWALDRPWVAYKLKIAHFRSIPITVARHGVEVSALERDPRSPAVLQSRACDSLALGAFDRYSQDIASRKGAHG